MCNNWSRFWIKKWKPKVTINW